MNVCVPHLELGPIDHFILGFRSGGLTGTGTGTGHHFHGISRGGSHRSGWISVVLLWKIFDFVVDLFHNT